MVKKKVLSEGEKKKGNWALKERKDSAALYILTLPCLQIRATCK